MCVSPFEMNIGYYKYESNIVKSNILFKSTKKIYNFRETLLLIQVIKKESFFSSLYYLTDFLIKSLSLLF